MPQQGRLLRGPRVLQAERELFVIKDAGRAIDHSPEVIKLQSSESRPCGPAVVSEVSIFHRAEFLDVGGASQMQRLWGVIRK